MTLNGILAIFNLGTGEIIAIVLVILLLFGGRKIPELMRGLGKGVKSFKQGMNEVEEELKKPLEDLDKPLSNNDDNRKQLTQQIIYNIMLLLLFLVVIVVFNIRFGNFLVD